MKPTRLLLTFLVGLAVPMLSLAQPIITLEPKSQSVSLGASVTFQVKATGAAPLSYRWRFTGAEIVGAATNVLSLTGVPLSAAGDYLAIVSDVSGLSSTSRVATLSVDATFTKITTGGIVTNAATSWGAAWGDFDNDEFIDLVVSNSGADFLYRNNHDGTFIPITSSPVVMKESDDGSGVAWADYDNDGNLDLVVGKDPGKNNLFRNNGDGTFTKTVGNAVVADGQANSTIWGDYNNDGHVDLMITAILGPPNRLYRNNGDDSFTKMTSATVGNIASDAGNADSGTWGDYDNDGDLDMFVTHFDAKNFFYRNNGNGTFTKLFKADTADLDAAPSVSGGPTWGDYDNDGDLDLFVTQGLSLELTNDALFRNNGNGTFTKMTSDLVGPLVNDHEHGQSCAWADYDNDGWLDLYVTTTGLRLSRERGRKNLLYHNNGDGSFKQIISGSLANDVDWSEGGVWGDYDNDGFMDLFVANGGFAGNQPDSLFRNNGNTNGWLKLRLVGTVSNRAAIGAKVRVQATISGKKFWQMREISGGDAFLSQNDLRPNFGLGNATMAEVVRIEWPSGIVQELHRVAPKQFLTVTEPARLQALGAGAFRVQSWKGMAFEVQASTDLNQWSPLTTVTNLTGTLEFTDPNAANDLRRFYRTVLK